MSLEQIIQSYTFTGPSIQLGKLRTDTIRPEISLSIPLKMMNRHGLIAGATGTGKTRSLQLLVEQLSASGVPTLVMDVKGDLSGLAFPNKADDQNALARAKDLGLSYVPNAFPVEMLSITGKRGAVIRSTMTEFGPLLLSKILDLNETQYSVLALLFKMCDDKGLALLDVADLKAVLAWVGNEGKDQIGSEYGSISSTTIGTIMRKIIMLEEQGGEILFGEPSFDVQDLLRYDGARGIINLLDVSDMQDKPHVFSTVILSLLDEIYETFPESGDLNKPKLVIFVDEAHWLFDNATDELKRQLEMMIKLIRSKGVGIFFCTQLPDDVPQEILSQLGTKVQHALRAFTERDRKAIKTAVENYPLTDLYDKDQLITQLGIGEAFFCTLNEKGVPTELAHSVMLPPTSLMGIADSLMLADVARRGYLSAKYRDVIDRESARELLQRKVDEIRGETTDGSSTAGILGSFQSFMQNKLVAGIVKDIANMAVRSALGKAGVKTSRRSYF